MITAEYVAGDLQSIVLYEGTADGDITHGISVAHLKDRPDIIAFLVKAVNCHTVLLEACVRANSCLAAHGKIDRDTTLHRLIQATIAEAEEQ